MNVREPWAVYELDGSGVDAIGNGTVADLTNTGAGILGSAAAQTTFGDTGTDLDFLLTGNGTFGFWYNVTSGDLAWEFGDGLISCSITGDPENFYFNIGSNGTNIQMFLLGTNTTKTETTAITTAGWHHFAFTRTGNVTQFYVDGVAVGSPEEVTPLTEGSGGLFSLSIGQSEGGGRHDQIVFAEVAYTTEELAYIYNASVGRLYVDWNPAPPSGPSANFGSGGGFGNLSHGNGFN